MNAEDKGQTIRSYRERNNMSQRELGEALDWSQSLVADYEKGRRKPKEETINRIAVALSKRNGEKSKNDYRFPKYPFQKQIRIFEVL